jgi:hypothetical protein
VEKKEGSRGEITCKQQPLSSCKRNAIVDHHLEQNNKDEDGENGDNTGNSTKHAIAVNLTCFATGGSYQKECH